MKTSKNLFKSTLLALLISFTSFSCNNINTNTPDTSKQTDSSDPSYLFVQTASSGSFKPIAGETNLYTLTLNGVSPVVTYFSDRPYRIAGEIDNEELVNAWSGDQKNDFAHDPPNAALTITDAESNSDVIVIELIEPIYNKENSSFQYKVRVVNNSQNSPELKMFDLRNDNVKNIPENFNHASLFIDNFWSKVKSSVKKVAKTVEKTVEKAVDEATKKFEEESKKYLQSLEKLAKDPLYFSLDEFQKLTNIILPNVFGSCANAAVDIKDVIYEKSTSNEKWMTEDQKYLKDLTLKQVSFPGTHDSATYAIDKTSDFTPEFFKESTEAAIVLNQLKNLIPLDGIKESISEMSKAQRHSIYAQLQAGIRSFDLRTIAKESIISQTGIINQSPDFFIEHGLYSDKIDVILNDIKRFTDKYPREIILLDLQHFKGKDAGDISENDSRLLADKIISKLSDRLLENDGETLVNKTISSIWEKNKQIIALHSEYDHLTDDQKKKFWDRNNNIYPSSSSWPNKQNSADLIKNLKEDKIPNRKEDKLFNFQGEITFDPSMIARGAVLGYQVRRQNAIVNCLKNLPAGKLLNATLNEFNTSLDNLLKIKTITSLKQGAEQVNPEVEKLLRSLPADTLNMVSIDYLADYPSMITYIRESNRHKTQDK